ncbi:MAG: LamG domain-containing protein, partial [Rhodocyclaceae bacterium]|nr:LamG domain-containing protein [Rhodocyclaceae bacterium]
MKEHLPVFTISTIIIICYLYCTTGVMAQQIPVNGLVAHWPFTGNVNDVHGTHHGNPSNITPAQGKMGMNNTAYTFNHANATIGIPYQSDMNVNNISICAIFKPIGFYTNTCQGNFILSRGTQGTSNGSYILEYFDNTYNSCSVADTNYYVMAGSVGSSTPPGNSWQTTTRIHTNNWYCTIFTYDGSNIKIYVNGVLTTTVPYTLSISSSTDSICIGKYPWGGTTFPYNFIGVLDDIAIYNRALTATEVDSYCNNAPLILPDDTTVYISHPLNKTAFCPGDTVHINYKVTFPFRLNNTFTAQLSNAAGSFTNPVNIGSLAYNDDSVIVCTIPAGTPAGIGYRVRIVGSAPGDTSVDNGVNLTVHPVPTPAISSNAPFCEGDTIQLTATYTGATFSWTGPG